MEQQQQNNIVALCSTLFDTLRGLSDKDNPLDVERAKAICHTSQAIINSVKVEIDFAKVTGLQLSSAFIPTIELTAGDKGLVPWPYKTPAVTQSEPGVTVHKAKS